MISTQRSQIDVAIRLLRRHLAQQIQASKRKKLQREQKRGRVTLERIDSKDVYLPPRYSPHAPHTYGTQSQITVVRTGTVIGMEAAF